MNVFTAVLLWVGAYLYGSINLAIILSRCIGGFDIRRVGTGKAGTANTMRNLGWGWGLLVFLFDISKGMLPLLLASPRILDLSPAVSLIAAGAAVVGHCRPLYYQFRGGGGVAAVIGAMIYLMPGETVLSLAAAFICVQLLLRRAEHRIGQWVSVLFLLMLPVAALISAASPSVSTWFGGVPWCYAASALGFGVLVLLLNQSIARQKRQELHRIKHKED